MDFFYQKNLIPAYYIGTVAENLALEKLKKKGFKILVRSPPHCLSCYAFLPEEEIIKERRESISRYTNEPSEKEKTDLHDRYFCRQSKWRKLKIPPCPISEKYLELMKYAYKLPEIKGSSYYDTRTWDFTAKKDDKIYLIEVKANRSRLVGNQRKVLLHAKKLGFIPLLIYIGGLEFLIRYEELSFEEL